MRCYRIHLIRCGYTQNTLDGIYEGRLLDDSICRESEKELIKYYKEYNYPQPENIFVAPHKRCIDTADLLFPDAEQTIIDGLSECDFGSFEGMTAEVLKTKPEFAEWIKGGVDCAPPGGESSGEFSLRVRATFANIVDAMMRNSVFDVGIVAPGGVILAIMALFAEPELPMSEWVTPPGTGYTIGTTPANWGTMLKFDLFAEIPEIAGDDEDEYADNYHIEDYENEQS